jgi:hypothetical protein
MSPQGVPAYAFPPATPLELSRAGVGYAVPGDLFWNTGELLADCAEVSGIRWSEAGTSQDSGADAALQASGPELKVVFVLPIPAAIRNSLASWPAEV